MGGSRQSVLAKKKYLSLWEICRKFEGTSKWQFKEEHFVSNCRSVIWIFISSVQHYRWRCTSPWKWLEELKQIKSGETKTLLFLQNRLIPNKQPYNFLSGDVRLNHCLQPPWRQLSQPQNRQDPLLRVTLRFRSFCKALCFRISIRWLSERSWSWESSNWNTPSASFARICALGLMMYTGTGSKRRKYGTT